MKCGSLGLICQYFLLRFLFVLLSLDILYSQSFANIPFSPAFQKSFTVYLEFQLAT